MLIQLLISSRSILITYDFLHKQSCHLWAKTVLFLFSKSMYLLFLFAPLRLYLWLSFKFEGQFCQIKNFGWQVFPPPALWIYQFTGFWPTRILLRNWLIHLLRIPCIWWVSSLVLLSGFSLCLWFSILSL